MRKPFSAILSVVLAATLACGLVPSSAFAALSEAGGANASPKDAAEQSEVQYAEAYGFDDFGVDEATEQINAATADGATATTSVQRLYELMCQGYENVSDSIDLKGENLTVADFKAAETLVAANPEYYWAASYWRYGYYDKDGVSGPSDGDPLASVSLYYCVDTSNLAAAKANTEDKITEALSWVDFDNMTQFQATQALHDYLVRNCSYDESVTNSTSPVDTTAYSAYGALVDSSCVCQGYALAYKLLLKRAGLSAVLVISTKMNHAWNMVQMEDGQWYHVDVTWDDSSPDDDFDADVSHKYFLRADSTMKNSLSHYGWEAAYTTPTSDYANRTYATYNGPAASTATSGGSGAGGDGTDASGGAGSGTDGGSADSGSDGSGSDTSSDAPEPKATYGHSAAATSNGVTFTVQWNDPTAGKDTTFHVTQTGGSNAAKARMDVPTYYDPDGSNESVCDPSQSQWSGASSYKTLGTSGYDFSFSFTASGTYQFYFYFMDTDNGVTWLRAQVSVTIDDADHPAVSTIVSNAVSQARAATGGSDYAMALWLHDWELDQLDYDYSLNYCSAESGLSRGKGTCESFQRIYQKLLTCAGLENGRMEGNGHTWNAVEIDGKWCQVDVNWDDDDGTNANAYGFDAKHLYFGLTDELMAVAHSDHAATYQADGYAYRSTDLSNNYFVRSGQAATWAQAYASRIQAQLDSKAETFSIESDNASLPPSICGIQNAIVAAAINQMDWAAADGAKATLSATSNVKTAGSTSWTATYDFAVEYAAETQTVFRMYNPITSEHLFTTSESEYESLTAHNWKQEGRAWSSPTSSAKGVYRLYNPALGALGKMSHHYTTSKEEADKLVAGNGWQYDNGGKPLFYSAEDAGGALGGASPVYRLYNGGLSAHHYTLDSSENDSLTSYHGWKGEGVGFYAYV